MEEEENSMYSFYDELRAAEFPALQELTYLDYAGSALASSSQLKEAHDKLASTIYGNPHSKGPTSKRTRDMISDTRSLVLEFFGASNAEYDVIFTSGATSSLKLLGDCFPLSPSSHFVYALNSHTSVLGLRSFFDEKCIHSISPHSIRVAETSSDSSYSKSASAACVYHLLALPGECNFSGAKYDLRSVSEAIAAANSGVGLKALINRGWDVSNSSSIDSSNSCEVLWLLDAAKLASTSPLLLDSLPSAGKPHFVVASFYKLFGHPTGIGVLLVRRDVSSLLVPNKKYYGGGTVVAVSADTNYCTRNSTSGSNSGDIYEVHRFLEDGTPNYHGIAALSCGFRALDRAGGMQRIQTYTLKLAHSLAKRMRLLRHEPLPGQAEGTPLCEIYGRHFEDDGDETSIMLIQGPVVTFNLKWSNGQYIGFSEVGVVASLHNIQLRTGCFCCVGGCQEVLGLTSDNIRTNATAGRNCWDESSDIVDGKPTGAVRVSLGYSSTRADVDRLLHVLVSCFLNQRPISPASHVSSSSLQLRLHSLYVYPIKSCAGIRAVRWPLGSAGLMLDREWAVCDVRSGRALTQKNHPSLALCRPTIDWTAELMTVSAPEMPLLILSLRSDTRSPSGGSRIDIRICRENCSAVSTSAQADEWFSRYLHTPCTLVRQDKSSSSVRSFVNEAQFLLLTTSSVAALAEMLHSAFPEDTKKLIPPADGPDFDTLSRVFRPNILVSGLSGGGDSLPAHEEDNWKHIRILSNCDSPKEIVRMCATGPCSRCSMVNVNPNTGSMDGHTLKVLSSYRRDGTNIHFGQFLKLTDDVQALMDESPQQHVYLEVGMTVELS